MTTATRMPVSRTGEGPSRSRPPLAPSEREPAPPLPTGTLAPAPVPAAAKPQPTPLIRIILPAVMLLVMLGMVGLMMTSGSAPHPGMLLFPVMMLMGMATMFAPQNGDDTDETRRTYLRHLGVLRANALRNAREQRAHQLHRHPNPKSLWSVVGGRRMWERSATAPDAYEVRIGLGTTSLCTPIQVGDVAAPEDLDPVCAVALRHTVRAVGSVPETPVSVQLQAFRAVGLAGPDAPGLARAMVVQLAFAHGPEALGIAALGGGWDWLKWLPHARHPERAAFRVLVVDGAARRWSDDPAWDCVIDVGTNEATELGRLAVEDGLVMTVDQTLRVHTLGGMEEIGAADLLTTEEARVFGRAIAAYRRPDGQAGATGAGSGAGDLLALLGLPPAPQLTAGVMWAPRGRRRLAVPIGRTEAGEPLVLDLKESALGGVGPHGLCIGATGSGKSELLRTLVLALAATHSPADLNFVLVDFKGGATFLGLERLPHTAAVITNLAAEATLVERMHDAISGEMNRRQELLREAGNFASATAYNAHLPEGAAPLPALVIVLDEFSELLGQHPDFADLFVAVGRLGRSLDVHLLLASQRLEEGRLRGLDSHLSYRIGLKTFSPSESRQVLGVPDAYRLPSQPGAGYLKTDAEEVVRFRAAYVSGPLLVPARPQPTDEAPWARVRRFDSWEDVADEERDEQLVPDPDRTLIDAVVDAAVRAAEEGVPDGEAALRAREIWLPPLPAAVPLGSVVEPVGSLRCAVGVIDRPYLQRQDPLVLDLGGGGGHLAVCGGPQSGKSTMLRTVLTALAATHSAQEVRFYVLDLAGTGLETLGRLPHTAGVAQKGEQERVRRTIAEVVALIDAAAEADGADRYPGHTFLVIDGWHVLHSEYEDLVDQVSRVASDGLARRVHLLVSTPRWSALRPAVRDLLGHRLELRLGEAMDSLIDRRAQQKLPAAPGRGLTKDGEHMLVALSAAEDIAQVMRLARERGDQPVAKLKLLPRSVGRSELARGTTHQAGILLGQGGARLEPVFWDPGASPHLVCVGVQGSGKSTALATLIAGIAELGAEQARLVVVDPRRTHLGAIPESMVARYCATTDAIESGIRALAATLTLRLPGPEVQPTELKQRSWWSGPDLYLVVDDLALIADHLLQPLLPLIPHAADIGFHMVLARKSGGIGRALFQQFLSSVRDQSPSVLVLSAEKDEGAIFGVKPAHLPPGRGTWQVHGTVVGAVQVAVPDSTPEPAGGEAS